MTRSPRLPNLRQRLRRDLTEQSPAAAASFALFGLVLLWWPLGADAFAPAVRISALFAVAASVVRFFQSLAILRTDRVSDAAYRTLSAAIVVNALAWGTAFAFSTLDRGLSQRPFFTGALLLVGFATASINTLAADPRLASTFSLATIGGQIVVFCLLQFLLGAPVSPFVFLCLLVFLGYTFAAMRKTRILLVGRHLSQLRLELANRRLERSRRERVEQTARTVHASRLASLGEMAAGIAHEINNPLAIVNLSLDAFQVALKRNGAEIDVRAMDAITRCQRAVGRISAIVRALKNFSRAGDLDPAVCIPAAQVINDVLDLSREKMKAHLVEFWQAGDLEAPVLCRPVEIAQVLVNLLNNAFSVVLDLEPAERKVELTVRKRADAVEFAVSNTGPKIAPAVREKLFQPFFTTKPPGEGTGLGLSISREIARRHGGELFLDEGAERTTFVLRLPACVARVKP